MDILDCIFVFIMTCLGYGMGYRTKVGEKLTLNPIKIYKQEVMKPLEEIKEEKKQAEEFTKLRNIMTNIDNYKGTSEGQRRVK